MIEIALLMMSAFFVLIVAVGGGVYFYKKKKKKDDEDTPSNDTKGNGSNDSSSTDLQDGGRCSGEWKKGGVVTYYDVNHPKDGDGRVAGLDFKPKSSMYATENVVSVVERDWPKYKYKYVDIRFNKTPGADQDSKLNQVPVFTSKILDFCSDKDCGGTSKGCCSANLKSAKKFAGVDSSKAMLFDIEQQTLKRAVGDSLWPAAKDAGVMNVEYKICDAFQKSSLNSYK